jgi:carbon-monoxide dehydrogenase small subunit
MADGATLHPLQQAFWDQHGLGCALLPGMIEAAWLLEQDPKPNGRDPRGDQRQPVSLHGQ